MGVNKRLFPKAPSSAEGKYPTAITLASSYSSTSNEVNPSNQTNYIRTGVDMSNDGTKFFSINEYSNNTVYEYDLSTAYDLTSMTLTATDSFDPPQSYSGDLKFSPDGSKMFIVTTSNNRMYQYNLSTAFDISTRDSGTLFDPSYTVHGFAIVNSGNTMFTQGYNSSTSITLRKWNLSTPYTLTGASYVQGITLSASTIGVPDVRGYGGDWSEDGKQFILGTINGANASIKDLFTIDFATAYDLDGTKTYNTSSVDGRPGAVKILDGGTKMIWGDEGNSKFRMFNI